MTPNHRFWFVFFLFLAVAESPSLEPSFTDQPLFTSNHEELVLDVPSQFQFVAFGDTRFHDPADTEAANAVVRQTLVKAIDEEKPAFVSIGGDIVYSGDNPKDWQVWDTETSPWRDHKIVVYPALGNHDLHGDQKTALGNYFARFPAIKQSRFYSVQIGNSLLLVLDSALDELTGPQGDWLHGQIDHLPSNVNFVFFVFHHPPYTSSSDEKTYGGGHSAREKELGLAAFLEEKQKQVRARFVVFNGHVHNYERHEHNGITYFVTGGGGAHAYPINRKPADLYKDTGINYHYLLVALDKNQVRITMKKLEFKDGKPVWTQPDEIVIPTAFAKAVGAR
jgi:Icc-related predicted phosphoesterase